MTEEEFDIDLIERYHRGQLEQSELGDFIARQATDRDFAEKVRAYQELIEGIAYYGRQKDFATTVAGWEQEYKAGRKGDVTIAGFRLNRTYLAIAATVLLLAVPLGTWLVNMNATDPRLAPYEDMTRVRTPDPAPPTPFSSGMSAYNQGDYNSAARLFRSSQAENPDDFMTFFYLAESYLALNKTDSARMYYRGGQQLAENPLSELSDWRLALSYLKDDDLVSLKTSLQDILSREDHAYHKEALGLYREHWSD